MILVDLNQVLISNVMVQTRGARNYQGQDDTPYNISMLRHMVINSMRGYNLKFKKEYGDMILCADAGNPWRRDIFPHYKHSRRAGRETSETNWDELFMAISDIRREIQENFPYIMMYVEKAEADDIIATLVKHTDTKVEPIMIVSGDKDFIQLQQKPGVKQYAPIQKKFIGEDIDPRLFIHEQIIKGDRSDGVPNILSDDDIFTIPGAKQRPINKKRLEEWSNVDDIPLGSQTKKYYERNKTLIDLNMIPQEITSKILNTYRQYEVPSKKLLLPYFMKHKLKSLMTHIGDF